MANNFPEATALAELAGYRKLAEDWVSGNSSEPPESLTTWQTLNLINSYDALRAAAEAALTDLEDEHVTAILHRLGIMGRQSIESATDLLRAALHPQQEREGKS